MKKSGFVFPAWAWKPCINFINFILLFSVTSSCFGFQDTPQQAVDELKTKMASINSQLTAIEAEINTGVGDLTALQGKYQDVLDELNDTIEELKQSCLTAIAADASNQENIQTVMGILLNDANKGADREVLMACDQLIAAGIHPAYFEYAAKAGRIKIGAREIFDEALIRLREFKSNDLPRVLLKTNKGDITVELYENEAPQAVANFITLVESGFYDDCLFHSVIESSHAQTGGPTRKDASRKTAGYKIYCECYNPDARPHFTDVLSMAVTRSRDSGASQFLIALERTTDLDGKHTVFGRIIKGHSVTDQLVRTMIVINGDETEIPNASPDYIISAEVIRKRDHEYKFRKVGDPQEKKEAPVPPPTEPQMKSFDGEDASKEPKMTAAEENTSDASKEDQSVDEKSNDDDSQDVTSAQNSAKVEEKNTEQDEASEKKADDKTPVDKDEKE